MPLTLNGTTGVSGVDGTAGTPALQGTDSNTGIVFGADTISLVEGGTAAFSVDSSANASLVGTLAMGSSFLRNRIINGAMMIDQRNAGAAVSVSGTSVTYPVDRFAFAKDASSGVFSTQQVSEAPADYINSAKITITTAFTSGSSEGFHFQQRVEGLNISDLNWGTASAKTITLSFWVRSTGVTYPATFSGSVVNNAFNRSYPFTYTINASNTWEYKTVTIPGDTGGTWLTTNGIGMRVYWNLGSGSSLLGTANVWNTTTGLIGATGSQSISGTLNATWQATGVQLEVGSVATPYERQIYSDQLAQCQRYYQVSNNSGSQWTGDGNAYRSGLTSLVPMRASPTGAVTISSSTNFLNNGTYPNVTGNGTNSYTLSWANNGSNSIVVWNVIITLSAEL
jgi:hypothetical protein